VPYIPSKSVIDNKNNETSSATVPGVPSAAAAKKALPIFIIVQFVLSVLVVAGAFWLAWGDDMSKYERLQDRYSTLIPAKIKTHQKYASIASEAEEVPFAMELERGTRIRGHRPTESATDLPSQAALMGTYSPPRHSMESDHSHSDPEDIASLRRVLDSPNPQSGHRRNPLFL
jgi:hypothetical protein